MGRQTAFPHGIGKDERMFKKISRILRRNDGDMEPFTAVFLLLTMLMLAFSLQAWRFHAVTNDVYLAMRSAAVAAVTENADALYAAESDMAGSAYTYTSTGWQPDADTSVITRMLTTHLGLRQNGGDWVKTNADGQELYRLSNLNVTVSNPFVPSEPPGTAPMLTVTVTYTLKTSFQSGVVVPVSVPMKVKAGIGGKF